MFSRSYTLIPTHELVITTLQCNSIECHVSVELSIVQMRSIKKGKNPLRMDYPNFIEVLWVKYGSHVEGSLYLNKC